MEKGSFQAPFSELSTMEFREEGPKAQRSMGIHHANELRLKSSTVEALLAQNEDLMARVKVSMRRLTSLESENDHLRETEQQTRTQNASLSDQLLVWKEKENYWQQKNQCLESESQALRARFPELEGMEEKIERYRKYHEKVRLQVKPYIQQLKAYAQNLTLEIRKLSSEIQEKELARIDSEKKLRKTQINFEQELRAKDDQNRQLVQIFESEKEQLRATLSELRKLNATLETKAERLEASLMRQDELENTVIGLRRAKEEGEIGLREDLKNREFTIQNLKKTQIENDFKIEDLQKNLRATTEESDRQKHRAVQVEEQLTSLRYLWNSKSEEIGRLQLQLQSLEKLNLDLSQRLNKARKGEASL